MQVFLFLLLLPFAAPSVSEIPFSFENNKILIEVQETVSGETLRLFLDTGAPTILKRSATFADSTVASVSFQLGDYTLTGENVEVNAFDQNEAFMKAFAEVDGLLGYDVMRQLNWKIDWKARKIYLSDQAFDIPAEDRLENIGNTKPMIMLRIDSARVQPSLVIDTGSPLGINIDQAFFAFFKDHAAGDIQTEQRKLSTWDEVIDQELHSMEVASFRLDRKPFGKHRVLFGTRESHLGTAFLQDYTLVLNWSKKEIGLLDN